MSTWRRTALVVVLAACGGEAGAPEGQRPAPGAPHPRGQHATAVPSEVVEGLREVAAAAGGAVAACRATTLARVTPEQAGAAPLPFGVDEVRAGCATAWSLFDDRAAALLGHARSGDHLLSTLARVGDDLDYVSRALEAGGSGEERRRAWEHVRDALDAVDEALRHASGPVHGYEADPPDRPEDWRRLLDNDERSVGRLHELLGRYAFDQGLDPRMVRRRMLTAFFAAAAADVASREAGLAASALPEEELAPRRAYVAATRHAERTMREVVRRYVDGEVVTPERRDEAMAETASARAVWHGAWVAERARVGG